MHLVLVPRVLVQEPEGPVFRPRLPASLDRGHGWGQASSEFEASGKVLCWVRGSGAEVDAVAAQAGSRVVGRCAPDAEGDRMVAALRVGDLKVAREEFLAAYREVAIPEERAARLQRGIAHALYLAAVVGLLAAAAWLAGFLDLPINAALGLVVLHSDNFNRANGSIHGSTMSDGLGAWEVLAGTYSITSNACVASATNPKGAKDSVMVAVGDQRTTFTIGSAVNLHGPAARLSDISNLYYCRNDSGLKSYKVVAGVATQLGSAGGTVVAGDAIAIDCVLTEISALRNGAVEVGPSTDSSLATGVGGCYGVSTSNHTFDGWQVETAPAGAVLRAANEGALAFSGGAL